MTLDAYGVAATLMPPLLVLASGRLMSQEVNAHRGLVWIIIVLPILVQVSATLSLALSAQTAIRSSKWFLAALHLLGVVTSICCAALLLIALLVFFFHAPGASAFGMGALLVFYVLSFWVALGTAIVCWVTGARHF